MIGYSSDLKFFVIQIKKFIYKNFKKIIKIIYKNYKIIILKNIELYV